MNDDLEGIVMEISCIVTLPSWSFLGITEEDNEKSLLEELAQ
jgi:hypothetical protein